MLGGSGEQVDNSQSEYSDDDSDTSIFDPPIENYRFSYSPINISSDLNGNQPQTFQITRVRKGKNKLTRSGMGGSGSNKSSFNDKGSVAQSQEDNFKA